MDPMVESTTSINPRGGWNRVDGLICLALMAVTAAVFWPATGYPFIVYDDGGYVANNPHVITGLGWSNVAWAFRTTEMANWHPLTWLSYMLDCQLFGVNAGKSHLVNLLWHALNTGLLFWVLKRMTGARWPSAFVAALFAWHPLHVESVAWIAERKDVLSAFFWMLTLGAYAAYVERPRAAPYVLALLFFALGLMCKPMLVSLPLALLLLDFWPLGRLRPGLAGSEAGSPRTIPLWGLVKEKVPFFLLAVASGLMTLVAQRGLGAIMGLPLAVRVGNAVLSCLNYIGKAIWPANLAVPYPYPRLLALGFILVTALVLGMLSAGVFRQGRLRPYLVTGWFWYLVTLAPVIGLIQAGEQAMADRYTYLPLIGLFIMVAWGAEEMTRGWRFRTQALGAAGIVILIALLAATRVQLAYWKSSETLFSHTIEVTQGNPVAHFNLGFALGEQSRYSEAAAQYSKAVELRPRFADAENNWGLALMSLGKPEEATEHYRAALKSEPTHALAHANLGEALAAQGKLEQASEHLSRALELDPTYAEAHYQLALILSRQGQAQAAVVHYREAIRLQPTLVGALNNLAWLLATHPDPAFRNGAEAVRLAEWACTLTHQRQAFLLGTLAAAYAEATRFPEAIGAAQKAVELASTAGQKEIAASNAKLLELYRVGQGYHEPKFPAQ